MVNNLQSRFPRRNLEWLFLILSMEEEFNVRQRRLKRRLILSRRIIRDVANPFEVTRASFVGTYRLTQNLVLCLVDMIRPHIRRTVSTLALPLELKVLAVLNFYATGSYQMPTGKSFDYAVAQPTMSVYILEVTEALNHPEVVCRLINFPATTRDAATCIQRNLRLGAHLPAVAYTDGSLIKIMKPSIANNRQSYIGRKSFASINVQFTCDRSHRLLNVLARFPGATNDSYIFARSALRRKMQQLNATFPCFLLGDSGYALEPWMMTPFGREEQPQPETPESRFNSAHSHDRCEVERTIGMVKEVFRCVNDERVLHYSPLKVCQITVAVAVLHNMRILAGIRHEGNNNLRNRNVHDGDPDDEDIPVNILLQGREVRARIVQELEQRRH